MKIPKQVKEYYKKMYILLGKDFTENQLSNFYSNHGICWGYDSLWSYGNMHHKGYVSINRNQRGFTDKFVEDFM